MNWISVEEQLPAPDVFVRAKTKDGQIRAAVYDGRGTWFSTEGEFSYKGVVHWMPLEQDECCDEECEGETERTCGTCGYWSDVYSSLLVQWGQCAKLGVAGESNNIITHPFDEQVIKTPQCFGCIHWEQKESDCDDQCEQHTFTTQDIRDIAREELGRHLAGWHSEECRKRIEEVR